MDQLLLIQHQIRLFLLLLLLHRLLLLFEDEILVSQYGQWILIEGIRRGVARVIYRLDSYIRMKQYDKE